MVSSLVTRIHTRHRAGRTTALAWISLSYRFIHVKKNLASLRGSETHSGRARKQYFTAVEWRGVESKNILRMGRKQMVVTDHLPMSLWSLSSRTVSESP